MKIETKRFKDEKRKERMELEVNRLLCNKCLLCGADTDGTIDHESNWHSCTNPNCILNKQHKGDEDNG